jgi:hypothetical protein
VNNASRLLPVLALSALILACSLSPAASPTPTSAPAASKTPFPPTSGLPTAAPSALPAASSTPAPSGTSISFSDLRLVIPDGLSSGTTNTTSADVEFPFTNPSNGDMPHHTKLILNGYPVQGTALQPQVHVFPAAEYGQYADLTKQVISALQGLQYLDGQPLPAGFPDGPFNAHVGAVNFSNGTGIRYLTQFDQAPLPVNNDELIYYFHGLSSDGSKYVQVILPVQAPFLAPDNNPASPLPTDGIPFTMDQLDAYFAAVASKLNATAPSQFVPSLDTLDALVQSIAVQP